MFSRLTLFSAATMLGLMIAGSAVASNEKMTVIDDFSGSNPQKTWSARPASTVGYEKGVLRLEMPKYQGQKGEAQWPGMTRSAAKLDVGRYNGVLIDLTNPTDHPESLNASAKDGRGNAIAVLPIVQPGQRTTLKWAFDQTVDGSADWTNIQSITLSCSRPSVDQVWLVHRITFYRDDPGRTAMGKLEALLAKTRDIFKQAQAADALSERQLEQGRQTLGQWTGALKTADGIAGKGPACREALSSLQSVARIALEGKKMKQSAVLWTVPLGTRFEPQQGMLQYQEPLKKLEMAAAHGEYQDRIVRLTNLTQATQDWKLRFESKEPSVAAALSLRQNQPMFPSDHSVVGDVLTPLDAAGVVHLSPGETAEIWVRADVKHHQWPSGKHEAKLLLQDLRRGGSSRMALPIEITVRHFNLADAPSLHLNTWFDTVRHLQGHVPAALDNLKDYGDDVYVLHPWHMPFPKLNSDGEPIEPLNLSKLDNLVQTFREQGKDVTLLVGLGLDNVVPQYQQLKSNLKPYSPAWEKGVHYWIGQIMAELKRLGIPTSQYALYVTDEPTVDELDITMAVTKIARSIDPSVRLYIDGIHLYDDAKKNDQLLRMVNIWQVGGDHIATRPKLLPTLKKYPNIELWVYKCRTHTRARQLGADAYAYYRLTTWEALRYGMTGIGYWVYCWDTGKDLWDGTTGGGSLLAYPDAGHGMLMSVRWELVRASLDDARYYRLLEQAQKNEKTAADVKSRIDALLGDRFDQVLAHPHEPELAMQWRADAGAAIEAAAK